MLIPYRSIITDSPYNQPTNLAVRDFSHYFVCQQSVSKERANINKFNSYRETRADFFSAEFLKDSKMKLLAFLLIASVFLCGWW